MSEFKRILTNLTMAYGLMSKEQFVDAIANYAQTRNMNDEMIKELIEQAFDELELTNKRRKAKQMFDAAEMERMSKMPFAEETSQQRSNRTAASAGESQIIEELGALRKAVENLTTVLSNQNKGE